MNPVTATQSVSELEKQPASMAAVDLRSDTVTRPTPEMRRAMAEAEVGDDVYGEDPTVNKLQARAAEIFGREAGALCALGLDGQSDCHEDLDAPRRRSDHRRARPHQSVRNGLDLGHRRLHAAHDLRRRRHPHLGPHRAAHPPQGRTTARRLR